MKTHRPRATRKITENAIRVIKEMSASGHTQADIAEYLGVSKIAVWRVLHGKEVQLAAEPVKRTYDYRPDPPRHQGVPSKCAGCGANVFKPCMVCEMRNERDGFGAALIRLRVRPNHCDRRGLHDAAPA